MNTIREIRRPIPLPMQYAADIVRSDGEISKIVIDGKKSRIEDTVNGMTTITIWRPDLGIAYRVESDTQIFYTIPLTPEMEEISKIDIEDDVEWEYVGTEILNLHTVDIYDVFTIGQKSRRSQVYVDVETHIRWKTVTFNKLGKKVITVETRNVVMGPPPASVFELPPGLKEMKTH